MCWFDWMHLKSQGPKHKIYNCEEIVSIQGRTLIKCKPVVHKRKYVTIQTGINQRFLEIILSVFSIRKSLLSVLTNALR